MSVDLFILVFCDAASQVKGLSSHVLSVAFQRPQGHLVRKRRTCCRHCAAYCDHSQPYNFEGALGEVDCDTRS